jgi:hypothetical protein
MLKEQIQTHKAKTEKEQAYRREDREISLMESRRDDLIVYVAETCQRIWMPNSHCNLGRYPGISRDTCTAP